MVEDSQDVAASQELPTVPADGAASQPGDTRRRWVLMAALGMMFLAAAVLVLGLALRGGSEQRSGAVAAAGGEDEGADEPKRASQPIEAVGVDDRPDAPETTEPEPDVLRVPFEWNADGVVALPFGTPREEVLEALNGALGGPPDVIDDEQGGECTPGTFVRWEADDVRLSLDEAGHLASVYFPAGLGTVSDDTSAETLGDLRRAFSQLSLEYVPANPDWGEFDDSYRWTIQGTDANASGVVSNDDDQATFEMVWLESERYQPVICGE